MMLNLNDYVLIAPACKPEKILQTVYILTNNPGKKELSCVVCGRETGCIYHSVLVLAKDFLSSKPTKYANFYKIPEFYAESYDVLIHREDFENLKAPIA